MPNGRGDSDNDDVPNGNEYDDVYDEGYDAGHDDDDDDYIFHIRVYYVHGKVHVHACMQQEELR